MTELDHITEFINSPAFPLMSENVKAETYAKQKELALTLVNKLFAEHIEPVIQKYGLNISVSLAESAIEKSKQEDKPIVKSDPVSDHVSEPPVNKLHAKRSPNTGLCVWLRDGSFIQESKASDTFIEAIKTAGVENVRMLNMSMDGENMVTRNGNMPSPASLHSVGNGYYINTHSNTAAKARLLQKIFKALHLNWKIEIVD